MVRVRWAWLAYPSVLQVAELIFLAVTTRATHRCKARWKEHRVPLLLAHLDGSIWDQAADGLARRTGLDDRVGKMPVRLELGGDDGIEFYRVHGRIQPETRPLHSRPSNCRPGTSHGDMGSPDCRRKDGTIKHMCVIRERPKSATLQTVMSVSFLSVVRSAGCFQLLQSQSQALHRSLILASQSVATGAASRPETLVDIAHISHVKVLRMAELK